MDGITEQTIMPKKLRPDPLSLPDAIARVRRLVPCLREDEHLTDQDYADLLHVCDTAARAEQLEAQDADTAMRLAIVNEKLEAVARGLSAAEARAEQLQRALERIGNDNAPHRVGWWTMVASEALAGAPAPPASQERQQCPRCKEWCAHIVAGEFNVQPLSQPPPSGWQPIASAPTGEMIVMRSAHGGMLIGCWGDYSIHNAPKFTHYQDAIGQRLDNPDQVPAQYRHLIADDQQRVARILSFPVSGYVLDVGCSDGAITRRIAEKWKPEVVVGVDVQECRLANLDESWIPMVWDAREPWPNHKLWAFDAVYACEVLEHLTDTDAQKAYRNMLAVLKPGGDLIVTVPNRYPNDLYEVGCRSRWAWPDHRSSHTYEKLRWLLLPDFAQVEFVPLYDGEAPSESIWLIARGRGRK